METTTLDDRSPNITYAGGTWNLGGVFGEFDGTSTWTTDAGSAATINFLGSQISVFGTIAPPANGGLTTNTSYNIDNSSVKFFTWGQEATDQFQQLIFQSEPLAPTDNHTLIITNIVPNGKFILDFINITSSAATTTTTPTPTPTTATATSTTPASTAPSSAASGNSAAKHVPVGAIVGAVLLGLFAVVVIIAGIIYLKRRRRSKYQPVISHATPPETSMLDGNRDIMSHP